MPLPLHYDAFGAGLPVVILHGLFGSSRNWRSVARVLAGRYRVYTVDLRNHGRSPHADSMDYRSMAGDIGALLMTLDLADVALVGHSMGGKVAMTLALDDPARLSCLVVVDIAPAGYADRYDGLIDALLGLPLERIRRRGEADRLLEGAVPDASLRAFLLQNLVIDATGARWRLNLRALGAEMPRLVGPVPILAGRRYEGPTIFIRGGRSDRIGPSHEQLIAQHFPDHALRTIARAGHWPHAETPDEFLELLQQALAR